MLEPLSVHIVDQSPKLFSVGLGLGRAPIAVNGNEFDDVTSSTASMITAFSFYAPSQEVAGYYVIPSELLSVCLSVRPSAVAHSCPLHNFDTARDNFTNLGTNIKHDQTTCRD